MEMGEGSLLTIGSCRRNPAGTAVTFGKETMNSGYDDYTGTWGDPYYDDEAVPLRGLVFARRVFSKTPALVAVHVKNGWREQAEYKGQAYDPKDYTLVANRWDHQHCCVCQFTIAEGMSYWATEDERKILCDACHGHYLESQ